MSELTNISGGHKQVLWQLLSTASALVLMGAVSATTQTKAAEEEDRPSVWIELGGSLQRVDTSEEKYAPPFLFSEKRPDPETVDPLSVGHLPRSAFGAEGKVTFQPEGSDWNFSAAVRFGRSNAHQHLHEQSNGTAPINPATAPGSSPIYQHVFQFIDAKKDSSESHAILDFQVGKDVGFGMFGAGSSSVFNAGVRFAQFDSHSSTSFASDPDAKIKLKYFTLIPGYRLPGISSAFYHIHKASASASRSFHGIGPSLSWNGSLAVHAMARLRSIGA